MLKYVDMHCDTLLRGVFKENKDMYDDPEAMLDFKRMAEGNQSTQFFAVFFPPRNDEKRKAEGKPMLPPDDDFFERVKKHFQENLALHKDIIAQAFDFESIKKNEEAGKLSAVLTIEDGRMIDYNMDKLQYVYDCGVRAIALTWNYTNCFGFPNSQDPEIMNKGLTDFGKEAILKMNDLGILVDVSHLSDGGFYDVAQISKKPFVATHSNCRSLCPHTRCLTDDMIKLLANKGGVSGINFGPTFLHQDVTRTDETIEALVSHIKYFINIGGEDCVGLGTDFDGVSGTFEVGSPNQMYLLFEALKKAGLTEGQIEKVARGNVLRVMKETIG